MIKSHALILLVLSGLLLGLSSCKDEIETLDIDYGYEYFPVEVGHWVVYQIDSLVRIKDFDDELYSYQVKEEVESEFTDDEGRAAVRIARYLRTDSSTPWESIAPNIWYAVRTEQLAEKVEENLRFLKLTFPIREGKKWWGNTYIDTQEEDFQYLDGWQYECTDFGAAKTINGLSFDSTLTILQNDYYNLQEVIFSEEVYAKNIGLVEKTLWNLELAASTLPPLEQSPWPDRGNEGHQITWKVIDYKQ